MDKRLQRACKIADDPEHPAWADIVRRLKADLLDPPLVVLGQGDFKTVITGDDLGGTGFFPLRKAPLRSKRAALSLHTVLLWCESVGRRLRSALSFLRARR